MQSSCLCTALLPCVIDLEEQICTFDSMRMPCTGFQYPIKNRGIKIIRKYLFIRSLVDNGVLSDGDEISMAAQFAFPISAWISLCDRESEREEEILPLVKSHIRQFFKAYAAK